MSLEWARDNEIGAEIAARVIAESNRRSLADPPPELIDEQGQVALFDVRPYWITQWVGMPEFIQEDLTPVRSIIVHFETEHDLETFARLVEQSVGPNLKSIWYPEAEITRYADKRYVTEREAS